MTQQPEFRYGVLIDIAAGLQQSVQWLTAVSLSHVWPIIYGARAAMFLAACQIRDAARVIAARAP